MPVEHAGRLLTSLRIDKTRIVDRRWAVKHFKTLHHFYCRAPHFAEVFEWLEPLYGELADEAMLSVVNERLLDIVAQYLGIKTPFKRTSDYFPNKALDNLDRREQIIRLCKGGRSYPIPFGPRGKGLSGRVGHDARRRGGRVDGYSGYPPYPQLWETMCPTQRLDRRFLLLPRTEGGELHRKKLL